MQSWDFLVRPEDLSRTEVRPAPASELSALVDGQTLLEVERFSLTANNITYGVVGDQLGYWRFFPAPEGWGRIPVWGFARVTASRVEGVAEGTRLYGYWPMSTHFVAELRPAGTGYVDAAAHRAALPPSYNRYETAPETPHDDHLALLRPLFTTSFLLDDFLSETAPSATVLLSSASSRTALGLAWMLKARGAPAVALTSERNRAFVEGLGLYARTALYSEVEELDLEQPAAFVDLAGDAAVRAAVHRRFADDLISSTIVGVTHHGARNNASSVLAGPQPTMFFAPDRLVARRRDWGADALADRVGGAMTRFIESADWLIIERSRGPDALDAVYREVLSGTAKPGTGHIVSPC